MNELSMNEAGHLNWAEPDPDWMTRDELKAQVNIYEENIILRLLRDTHVEIRQISGEDLANIFAGEIEFRTGLLPEGTLWHKRNHGAPQTALWRPPQVWRVQLQEEAFAPPRRLKLPMPGLVFVCSESRAPTVYAAKHRPVNEDSELYRAPTFNVFPNGNVCPGTHKFPADIQKIPESFFESRFSMTGDYHNRSLKHRENLMALWEELDGQDQYPLEDLVFQTTAGAVF